ncbi:Alpha,alpha-trehalose-phosphate synthase [UDP-forming] [Wickerhamiella sorbophila]|uniref:Trehalose-6-phosphate synthase n=1 Tax=Wickerhamiella sorbophila TaxID=45607 RepID=A0A2T0FIE3_9ASCO|nr:Alpha,alpha-trehalose-phosphate synthase [UDP-forming] [Wickerhamiella sorbophila]PRT54760.1 Alpha,alpha-trehalose-phosphate synthase [UDP-forming] [Wickerhamiella sorbophila]
MTRRVIVVSNRLPVTTSIDKNGQYNYEMSSGGLVSALSSLHGDNFIWLGWPGIGVPQEDRESVSRDLKSLFKSVPVFLSDELSDLYYNGFSNSIIWPLFHYHPGEMNFDDESWEAYTLANRLFAQAIANIYRPGDVVWVHDYHLMILPAMIREEIAVKTREPLSSVEIAFFLHIPFPTSEIYRVLPVRREILLGVLQSDLIGFHTYDYVRHFLSSVSSILKLETTPVGINYDRFVSVGVFPIGITPSRFLEPLKEPSVLNRINELRAKFGPVKILLGVDRLDYIKGLPHKFHAFDIFLSEHPEWEEKVVLVQVAVPSRQDVEEYQNLRGVVNELVGRINGKYGSIEFTPIHFLHRSLDFKELIALYAMSDVCIVSSTRDGMNLVAYEYIACQEERNGQLILSEFAGAAQSLNGAIIVNPWNMEEMAEAIHTALTMSDEKRQETHGMMFHHVSKFTTQFWLENITKEINRIEKEKKLQFEKD